MRLRASQGQNLYLLWHYIFSSSHSTLTLYKLNINNCLDVSVRPGSSSNSPCRKNHSHPLPVLPQLTPRQECPWLSYYSEDMPATISTCRSPGKEVPTTQVGSSSADFSCLGMKFGQVLHFSFSISFGAGCGSGWLIQFPRKPWLLKSRRRCVIAT